MTPTSFETWLQSEHPQIPVPGAQATLKLASEGATVPFIARYRKDQTGRLDEVAIRTVIDAKERWDQVLSRQAFIVQEIERQKKLTPELKETILSTFDPQVLEDLYLPFKQKRKTKATLAKEAGLGPLADWIWNCGHGTDTPQPGQTLELWAFTFRNEEHGFPDTETVIEGAQDILVERLAETQELRQLVRTATFEKGYITSKKGEEAKPNSKFDKYFDYHEAVAALLKPESSHRYLAVRRGWMEKELTLSLGGRPGLPDAAPELEAGLLGAFEAAALTVPDSPGAAVLQRAARLALKTHVAPSIEAEVHKALKQVADDAAIRVFAENLRKLLLASPFGSKAVLGVDPGVRTGCKLAVVDDSGKFLASHVLHLQTENGRTQAGALLGEVLKAVPLRAIAVGNGTAGRETETFLRKTVAELGSNTPVVMVNESGASVYSASDVAREEFPALDVTVRGAISIARRLQDPLAELVKIEPKSIGVGQYQHDVSGSALKRSLDQVVDSCVNQVGVNLNTASYHLLSHISGLGSALARAIVEHRTSKGLFRSRQDLLTVPRFSKKTFEQAAGFLRIPGGDHPLDNTGIHPEQYPVLEGLALRLEKGVADLLGPGVELVRGAKDLRDEVGAFTFDDIVSDLEKPGRDPRDEFVPFEYRSDVHELADLRPEMVCPGIVTNVTNFGAFVDVGVHQDGLVHVSQLSDRFVKDPRDVAHPGMHVQVRVLEVNLEKGQIALSMKTKSARPARPAQAPRKAEARRPPRKAEVRPGPPPPPGRRPETPRTDSSKPQPGRTRPPESGRPARKPEPGRGASSSSSPRGGSPPRAPAPQRVPLNNPFAVLAEFKKTLKPKG